jgi:Spy/CpxP family protein refolding chaperone
MARLRFLAVSLFLVALCSPWAAGNPADDKSDKAPETKMRGQLPQNWSKLGLSDKQKQDIYKVQNEYMTKIDALRKQMDDLRAAEKKEMEKVLTPAQKERLKEILTGKAPDTSK